MIRYYLKSAATSAAVVITDSTGKEAVRLEAPVAAGINTVVWPTRPVGGRGTAGPASANPIDQLPPLGEYTVTLEVSGRKFTQKARISRTQGWTLGPLPQVIR